MIHIWRTCVKNTWIRLRCNIPVIWTRRWWKEKTGLLVSKCNATSNSSSTIACWQGRVWVRIVPIRRLHQLLWASTNISSSVCHYMQTKIYLTMNVINQNTNLLPAKPLSPAMLKSLRVARPMLKVPMRTSFHVSTFLFLIFVNLTKLLTEFMLFIF